MTRYTVGLVAAGQEVKWSSGVDKARALHTVSELLDKAIEDPALWGGSHVTVSVDPPEWRPYQTDGGLKCL